jgi:hypothetical protein
LKEFCANLAGQFASKKHAKSVTNRIEFSLTQMRKLMKKSSLKKKELKRPNKEA